MKNQNGKVTIGAVLGVLAILTVVGFGAFLWLQSNSSWNLMFQGSVMDKVEVEDFAVPAAGTDLRAYSFTDSHGRHCTGVYSENSGSWGDCDYPPNWTGPTQ